MSFSNPFIGNSVPLKPLGFGLNIAGMTDFAVVLLVKEKSLASVKARYNAIGVSGHSLFLSQGFIKFLY